MTGGARAEDVPVPVRPGDGIGHRRLDDQQALEFLGDRKHGECDARRDVSHGDRGVVVAIGFGQQRAAEFGTKLRVLLDDDEASPVDLHRAVRGVFQPEQQTVMRLFRIGFECARLAIDMGDGDVLRPRRSERAHRSGEGD
jgi:hypothetical protein